MDLLTLYFQHANGLLDSEIEAFLHYATERGEQSIVDSVWRSCDANVRSKIVDRVLDFGDVETMRMFAGVMTDAGRVLEWLNAHDRPTTIIRDICGRGGSVPSHLFLLADTEMRVSIVQYGGLLSFDRETEAALLAWLKDTWPVGSLYDEKGRLNENGRAFSLLASALPDSVRYPDRLGWLNLLRVCCLSVYSSWAWEAIAELVTRRTRLTKAEAAEVEHLLSEIISGDRDISLASCVIDVCKVLVDKAPCQLVSAQRLMGMAGAPKPPEVNVEEREQSDNLEAAARDLATNPDKRAAVLSAAATANASRHGPRTAWARIRLMLTQADLDAETRLSLAMVALTTREGGPLIALWRSLTRDIAPEKVAEQLVQLDWRVVDPSALVHHLSDAIKDELLWRLPQGHRLYKQLFPSDRATALTHRLREQLGDTTEFLALAAGWRGSAADLVDAIKTARQP